MSLKPVIFLNVSSAEENILLSQYKHIVLSYFVAMLYHLQNIFCM